MGNNKAKVTIGLNDRLSKGLNKINRRLDKLREPLRKLSASFKRLAQASGLNKLKGAVGKLGGAFGNFAKVAGASFLKLGLIIGGTIAAVFRLVNSVATAGDNIAKTADQIGISVEALQELRFAADRSGVANAEFDKGLTLLSRNAAEAGRGLGIAKRDFEALGISVKDAKGNIKGSEVLLTEISKKFQTITDPAKKTAIAMNIFGRSGAKMINLLNAGPAAIGELRQEVRALGGVMDEDTARMSEAFVDLKTNLFAAINGIKIAFAKNLMPPIMEFFKRVIGFIQANKPAIEKFFINFAAAIPARLTALKDKFLEVKATMQPFINLVVTIVTKLGPLKTFLIVLAAVIIPPLIVALHALAVAVLGLGTALLTTPIGWIIGGIALLVAGVVLLVKNWQKVKAVMKSPFGNLIAILMPVVGIPLLIAANWEKVIAVFAKVKKVASSIGGFFKNAFGALSGNNPAFAGADKGSGRSGGSGGSFGGAANIGGAAAVERNISESTITNNNRNESIIKVQFDNTPSGTKIRSEQKGDAELDVSTGIAMAN